MVDFVTTHCSVHNYDRFHFSASVKNGFGGCHDYAGAAWRVIRRPLRGINDTSFRRPTPDWPIGRLQVGHIQGLFGVFNYY
jgi:hypothetical protein